MIPCSTIDSGRDPSEKVKIYYAEDSDPEKAGQGLAQAPFVHAGLGPEPPLYWMMSPAEQAVFTFLLQNQKPEVAIEIGTHFGGSLQVLARYCRQVYSLDTDPEVPRRLAGRFPNVEYITGPSGSTLPSLLRRIQEGEEKLGFVLVDGDHSAEGVRTDMNILLRYQPVVPLFIIMHDSFNPECRRGLRSSDWAANPHLHAVELDFVPGVVNPAPKFKGQLWGGLALAWLLPEPRRGHFEVTASGEMTFQSVQAGLANGWLSRPGRKLLSGRNPALIFLGRAVRKVARLLRGGGTPH